MIHNLCIRKLTSSSSLLARRRAFFARLFSRISSISALISPEAANSSLVFSSLNRAQGPFHPSISLGSSARSFFLLLRFWPVCQIFKPTAFSSIPTLGENEIRNLSQQLLTGRRLVSLLDAYLLHQLVSKDLEHIHTNDKFFFEFRKRNRKCVLFQHNQKACY